MDLDLVLGLLARVQVRLLGLRVVQLMRFQAQVLLFKVQD